MSYDSVCGFVYSLSGSFRTSLLIFLNYHYKFLKLSLDIPELQFRRFWNCLWKIMKFVVEDPKFLFGSLSSSLWRFLMISLKSPNSLAGTPEGFSESFRRCLRKFMTLSLKDTLKTHFGNFWRSFRVFLKLCWVRFWSLFSESSWRYLWKL